jgi:phenylpropionate dioxygenase-like ring-hydroxylating dioxygenase large terminal subunit
VRLATTPWAWYRDPAVLERENDAIFRRSWQYVGVLGQNNVVPGWAGRVPVVAVRADDGAERAFVNVCRHRGSIVVEEPASRRSLQCGYHAWTYGLDGSLRSAPRSEELEGDEELGLLEIRLESWGPFRFVNLDGDAPPLDEVLGEVPAMLAEGGIDVDGLAFHHRVGWEVAANWKIATENFLECYHCAVAHPGFSAMVETSPGEYRLERRPWHLSQFGRSAASGGTVPPPLAEHRHQRLPRQAEPLDRPDPAARAGPDTADPRLLLRPGRGGHVDRRVPRVR